MEMIEINGKRFHYWRDLRLFVPFDAEVTAFYAYTSGVHKRVLEVEYKHNDEFSKLRDNLIAEAQQRGIDAHIDNKTVIEITYKTGEKIYFGWYDSKFSIGFAVWTEYESNKKVAIKQGGNKMKYAIFFETQSGDWRTLKTDVEVNSVEEVTKVAIDLDLPTLLPDLEMLPAEPSRVLFTEEQCLKLKSLYIGKQSEYTCRKCGEVKATVDRRYSFGIFAGRMCNECAMTYKDHCGIDMPEGNPYTDSDEQIDAD
jgi:hypothetical protein